MSRTIQEQIKLPLAIAFEVVLQGIRIRFGRSLVTIMGVVLGIAFLMSILTSQAIKDGVQTEAAMRAELKRMLSFLTAETGAIRGKSLRLIAAGATDVREDRFLAVLRAEGATLVDVADEQTVATLVVGDGRLTTVPAGQQLLCFTRREQATSEARAISLDRELQPDEQERLARAAHRARVRSIWIIVISLLVTVIGISNAMLMSVTERFREIGTMKCLGALSAFIRQIFFIESSLVGLVGSIVGSVLGTLVAILIYAATYGFGLVVGALPVGGLVIYFAGSILAGIVLSIVAAIYPATFASRMVPAHALRSNV